MAEQATKRNNNTNKPQGTIHVSLAQTPLPNIVEKDGKEWIDFLDQDGRFYPQVLVDMMNGSAIHNAILTTKARMVAGKGLTYVKEGLTVEDQAAVEAFIHTLNEEDIVKKIALDYEVFGSFCLELIYAKSGKKIAQINHIDPILICSGKFNKERKVDEYFYSEDWSQWRKPEYQPISIAAYNPEGKDKRQILYTKDYRPGQKYYGLPGWISARTWIQIDAEIAAFQLASVKNGLTPNLWINMNNGTPPEEERRKFMKNLKGNYTADGNVNRRDGGYSQKTIVTYADDKDHAPEINKLEFDTAREQMFIVLNDQTIQNILAGSRITSPLLFGIKTEGQLGGSTELENAYKIFDANVITPQQIIIEKTLNKLLRANGLKGGIKIEKSDVVEFTFEDTILMQILTVNEMRRKINMPDLTDEQIAELRGTITSAPNQNQPMQ